MMSIESNSNNGHGASCTCVACSERSDAGEGETMGGKAFWETGLITEVQEIEGTYLVTYEVGGNTHALGLPGIEYMPKVGDSISIYGTSDLAFGDEHVCWFQEIRFNNGPSIPAYEEQIGDE